MTSAVGFIGLGQMGFGMAANLLKAGHDVLAYDVAAEPLARFAALGGRTARHPAQIGAECASVMVMVDARCTTWLLVKMRPSGVKMNPDPDPAASRRPCPRVTSRFTTAGFTVSTAEMTAFE